MSRLACWTLLFLLPIGMAWGAPAPKPAPQAPTPTAFQASLKDLERNVTLGEALTRREGGKDEFALVQKLADRGLETARTLTAKDPKSAEAHHLLGLWLLRGYRVVEHERLTTDVYGGESREPLTTVARGLADGTQAALEALGAARTLAPANIPYLTDYASALLESDQAAEAMVALKRVWQENLSLTPAQQLQVALLMSDAHLDRGELAEARGWLYRALSAQSQNLPVVTRLKKLDSLIAEAAQTPAPPPVEASPEQPEEEITPEAAEPEETTPAPEVEQPAPTEEEQPTAPAPEEEVPQETAPPAAEVGD